MDKSSGLPQIYQISMQRNRNPSNVYILYFYIFCKKKNTHKNACAFTDRIVVRCRHRPSWRTRIQDDSTCVLQRRLDGGCDEPSKKYKGRCPDVASEPYVTSLDTGTHKDDRKTDIWTKSHDLQTLLPNSTLYDKDITKLKSSARKKRAHIYTRAMDDWLG